ncbi:FG-GAP repeat protein, partial [Bacteroidota bacterium]|nr:FG-GAP repeat protein [Bacteroidota bacterium]
MSSDGNTVAIGADGNDGNGTNAGHVRIYDWNGSSWTQRGQDIDGEAAYDFSGFSVSINSDGNTVAIGAYRNNNGNGIVAGHVRIYNLNYQPCDGCTDPLALNYDSTVQYDDGSCIYPQGCTDSLAYNYDLGAITDDGTCLYCDLSITLQVYENSSASSCDGLAIVTSYSTSNSPISYLWSNGSTLNNIYGLCPGLYDISVTDSVGCMVSEYFSIGYGCTDSLALNYDSISSYDDSSCTYINGCTDSLATNFNPAAVIDDSSCCFVSGCTDSLSLNYNSQACFDNGSCIMTIFGCIDTLAINYNSNANTNDSSCCYISGCTNFLAHNYDSLACFNDGSCIFDCYSAFGDGYFVTNEGNFGSGNGSVSFISNNGSVQNNVFYNTNMFYLGDVVQSMSTANNKGYIVVYNSGKVEVVDMNTMNHIKTIGNVGSPRYFTQVSQDKAYLSDW